MQLTEKDISRFWAKVDKNGPVHPYDAALGMCWMWKGSLQNKGYGAFWTNHESVVSTLLAHRISFTISIGQIPDGMKALHSCDNPPCVNPAHLFLGTQKDNMQDCSRKGRAGRPVGIPGCRGVAQWKTHLDDDKVREIRRIYARGGVSQEAVGRMFGIKRTTVLGIVSHRKWAHVA